MGAAEAFHQGHQDHRQVRLAQGGQEVWPKPRQVLRVALNTLQSTAWREHTYIIAGPSKQPLTFSAEDHIRKP